VDGGMMSAAADKPLPKGKAAEIVKEVRENLQHAWDYERDNRREAAIDLQFLAGDQWPEQVRIERERDKRPMITINRLPQFVRQVTNDIRQSDLAIKTSPVDDRSDPKLATVFNGLIRQIQYQSSATYVYATAAEHQVSCGIGWFRITTEYTDDTTFNQEIRIKTIPNPLSVYCDPAAVEVDRSDANWIIVTQDMPAKAFKAQYPKASVQEIEAPTDHTSSLHWFNEENIRIAEYWRKKPVKRTLALTPEGETVDVTDIPAEMRRMMGVDQMRQRVVNTHEVEMLLVSGAEILGGPYKWAGKHIPIVPVIGGEVPLEKQRYRFGMVRFARDPQQLYNFYRTASAESIALAPKAPYLATPDMIGPFKSQWDTANIKNRPYLLYSPDPQAPGARPMREHPPETPAALMNEAERASEDMKATTGIYDAALGAKSNETSGRAILARQQEGDVSNYHYADNLERSLHYAGRILIDLIPKVYDSDRIVRVMGDDDEENFVPINKVIYGYDGLPVVMNDLSTARFDVRVSIGPSYSTKRQEMAVSMLEFLKISPDAAPLIMDLVAKNMDFPGAEEISKRLKNTVPPNVLADPDDPESQPPPPPDPMDDPTVRVELEYKTAQARKAMADAMKAEMEAAQMQQMAIQPQVIEPEIIDPRDEAIKDAQARKAMADAAMAELGVQNYQPPVPPQGGPGVDPSQLPAAPVDAYSPPDMGATQ
jgi:hypothetical protein